MDTISWKDFEKVTLRVGTFMSEFLLTGFVLDNDEVVIAQPERPIPDGGRLA